MAGKGRKSKYNLMDKACTNVACSLYGKTGMSNIVSNGTIKVKQSENRRRFLCKVCGKSFSSRSGQPFYDLRTPEEKIFSVFHQLLVKEKPIREVAKEVKVKSDTIRRLLKIAENDREKTNELLCKKLNVSSTKLKTLWDSVRDGTLHERAMAIRRQKL